mgnify:CR=1 FL=1
MTPPPALARRLPEARDNQSIRHWRPMIGDLSRREDLALAPMPFQLVAIIRSLDDLDRQLLTLLLVRFKGNPAGIETIAATVGEESDTLQDVYEPYLIQQGYLQRTPRGRVATMAAYRHLGVAPPATNSGLFAADEA